MGKTIDKVKKAVSGKGKKADKVSPEVKPEVNETPVQTAEVKPDSKKTAILPNGETIPVRGGFRAMYNMGNVGWQEMLANLRLLLNVAYYLIKIGAPDAIVKKYVDKATEENGKLEVLRVKIPSDMVTQLYELQNPAEAMVGSDAYIKAIRKLSELSKKVNEDRGAILQQVTEAKKMITSKA